MDFQEHLAKFAEAIKDVSGLDYNVMEKAIIALLVIAVWLIVRKVAHSLLWFYTEEPSQRYRGKKLIGNVLIIILIFIMIRVWVPASFPLGNMLTLLSAALTIALQDLVKSLAGWQFILWRQPFKIGDRIQIGNFYGDVIDINVFKFTINEIGNWIASDQSTGRVMHIPNSMVLNLPVANYTEGFPYIWSELQVMVTFESNWRLAKTLLQEIVDRHGRKTGREAEEHMKEVSKKYMLLYRKLTPIIYTSVRDSGILLSVRFLVEPRARRNQEEKVWEDILTAFAEHKDIDFAYPTQRFYSHSAEGKMSALPESGTLSPEKESR